MELAFDNEKLELYMVLMDDQGAFNALLKNRLLTRAHAPGSTHTSATPGTANKVPVIIMIHSEPKRVPQRT